MYNLLNQIIDLEKNSIFAQLLPLFLTHPETRGSLPVSSGKYSLALVPTIGILYITFPVGGAYLNQAASSSFCSLSISR